MKLKFMVDSIHSHGNPKKPSVRIFITNKLNGSGPVTKAIVKRSEDIAKIIMGLVEESMEQYHTSFILTLQQCKTSGIAVGDIIEMDIQIKNKGDEIGI